jgi:hypothetical protein
LILNEWLSLDSIQAMNIVFVALKQISGHIEMLTKRDIWNI